jgi:activator of HSP90 ATPase
LKQDVTTLTQTVIIPKVSPQQVYDAYVDPKKHSAFTESKATGKPVVGGKFTAWDGYIYGRFLELVEGKVVVQEWITTDWEEGYGPSRLELIFTAVAEGTQICMVHSNVPQGQAPEIAAGWEDFYWTPLKDYFSKHDA